MVGNRDAIQDAERRVSRFECSAIVTEEVGTEVEAADRHEAARRFWDMFMVRPDHVGEDDVVGVCEDCGGVIFEDEPQEYDPEGIRWHRSCPGKEAA